MGLKAKFNLVMLTALLAGLALAAALSWRIVHDDARREVLQEATIMMAQATAIRGYTAKEIEPLLADQIKVRFLPHTVPSWAAQTNLRAMAAQFPDYTYKEAALNPTNPADRATDWESGIIAEFNRNPSLTEFTSTRDTPTGPVLSISKPIRITDKGCLTCHSTPDAAPASMIDLYGSANGFGWKLGDVIGAQIVSVPMRVALDRAGDAFKVYLAALVVVFAVTILLLNLLLHFVIVKPIRRMSAIASEVSLGNMAAPEFEERGRDEIASLAGSFNRMRRSLANAMKLLEKLKIADATPTPAEIGRYRVERVIGRGAMGVIYQAHDPSIDRKVAIKLIRADLLSGEDQSDYLARFQREARAAGRCTHPNIVAIYDFAVHEGNPFLAMEYVDGSNLGQILAQSGRFTVADAVSVIGQVLDALGCAHDLGIVHRDVKPANILVLPGGSVKMTDFGISRFDSSELTQSGSVIGTPSYMSPEQCRGDVVDARSDLFSTGVVLYEMLSGERPFPGRNFTEVAVRLQTEAPVDIRTKLDSLPPVLAAVLDRALAKSPGDRFASAGEMAMALRQAAHEPQQRDTDQTVVQRRAPDSALTFTDATLTTIERKLAHYVGPIARHLVQNAARHAGSFDELCDTLAQRIEQPEQRAQFRQEVQVDQSAAPAPRHADIAPDEVQRAEQELVRHVGPIARILVRRAVANAGSSEQLWQQLATHIERDADRSAFLQRRIN